MLQKRACLICVYSSHEGLKRLKEWAATTLDFTNLKKKKKGTQKQRNQAKTYKSRDSLVVTHPTECESTLSSARVN